jgi:Kef-type K+ transport system membrane component KefB
VGPNFDLATRLLAALAVVVTATTVCGRLAAVLGQPRVVGELVAGILLGPTLLGGIAPGVQRDVFPPSVVGVLYVLSTIGLTLFMFLMGAGLDHGRLGPGGLRRAGALAGSGIVPSFVLGATLALVFYRRLTVPGVGRLEFALFLGGALSITAFPVVARILHERRMASSVIGSLTLVAAAIDDAVAWCILALITALARPGHGTGAATTIAGTAVFGAVMLTLGRRLLVPLVRRVEAAGELRPGALATLLVLVLGAGWFTDSIGVFSVFGGFVTGLALPRSDLLRRELRVKLMDLNAVLLLPIFFAYSGLNTQLRGIFSAGYLLPLASIVAAATVGKYCGCSLTMRRQGFGWRQASAIGALMNARGLMILVFINIGLAYHLITAQLFSMLVLVALVTTAVAVPVYRWSMPAPIEDAERALTPVEAAEAAPPRAGVLEPLAD